MTKYSYIAGQRKTLIAAHLKFNTFTESYSFFSKNIKPNFLNFRNGINAEYWIPKKEILIMNQLGKKYLNEKFTKNTIKKIKNCNNNARKLVKKINAINCNKIPGKALFKLFEQAINCLSKMMGTLFLSQNYFTKSIEDKLLKTLLNQFDNQNQSNKYFNILINGYKIDGIKQEQINWYHYFSQNKKLSKRKLYNYILHNGWLIYNVFSHKEAYNYINKRYLKTKKKGIENINEEIKSIIKKTESQRKIFFKQTKIINKRIKILARTLRNLTTSRLEVKLANNSLEVVLNLKLLYCLSQKYKINFDDLLEGYFPDDIRRLILKNKKIEEKEINNRKKFVSWQGLNGKLILSTGNDAQKKVKKLLKYSLPNKKQKIFFGQVASKGKIIIGRARLIKLSDNKKLEQDIKRFKRGEIIVTIMTQPNIMPIANKAAGIVTDEGGICSHAAIISRELKIPCIVGTESATKIIKDGDMIKIDTSRGLVKIIK